MPKSRIVLTLGFFIALLPVLGFPHSWESFFQVASGLIIVLLSVLMTVDRRLMLKAKAEKRQSRRREQVDAEVAANPELYGRRATDNPQNRSDLYGRRATDSREETNTDEQ
ncbi:hypothetical protein KW790_02570 [Candidatus Parcubacteria bacterium]|nr:hypothetical protein [Candidatus Parcubacteria bacterium]